MKKNYQVIVSAPFNGQWQWLIHKFPTGRVKFELVTADLIHRGRKALIAHAFKTALAGRRKDMVVTFGPWLTLFTAVFMVFLTPRTKLLSFTFNHGNGIFFKGLFRIGAWVFLRRVTRFVTHSRYETQLLSSMYRLPPAKMVFTHWAVQRPSGDIPPPTYMEDSTCYVCCIGRNNRDLRTFAQAVDLAGIAGIIITQANAGDWGPTNNIIVRSEVPLSECHAVMKKSLATILPLTDESTGAGHMTAVSSLLLGTPIIGTEGRPLEDYLLPGKTGLSVPAKNPEALAEAICRLRDDAGLRARLRDGAVNFANAQLTEERAAEFAYGLLMTELEDD